MSNPYDDELKEINQKSREVFFKKGIYPFIEDWDGDTTSHRGEIPGFQIFKLYPEWDFYLEDDEEDS